MYKNMIIDFKHKHSGHCETGATSGLLRHKGFEVSEPMVFGIGSGLYFSYLPFVKAQDAPLYAFRIMPGKIFRNTTRRLDVKTIMIKKFREPEEAMKALDQNIDRGIPTGVQVGTYHLKYFPPEYRLHYNFHNVVVFGRENGVYHISEPIREKTQLLAREDLEKARFAKGAFGPKGKMYYVLDAPKEPDFHKAVRAGIHNTVFRMTKQYFPYIGVRGIRKLARDIQKWPVQYPEEKASMYLLQLVRSIEEFGTGGAGYRYLFDAFLKESGELLQNDSLIRQAKKMSSIADQWRDFTYRSARFIKHREEITDTYSSLSALLMDIAEAESDLYSGLGSVRF
jgi:hypothetical protein